MTVRQIFLKKVVQGVQRGVQKLTPSFGFFGLGGTFGAQIACVTFSAANEASLSKNDAQKFLKVP